MSDGLPPHEVESARRRFEDRLGELRGAAGIKTERRPRSPGWTLLWAAAAVGFAFAAGRGVVALSRRRAIADGDSPDRG